MKMVMKKLIFGFVAMATLSTQVFAEIVAFKEFHVDRNNTNGGDISFDKDDYIHDFLGEIKSHYVVYTKDSNDSNTQVVDVKFRDHGTAISGTATLHCDIAVYKYKDENGSYMAVTSPMNISLNGSKIPVSCGNGYEAVSDTADLDTVNIQKISNS